MSALAIDLKDIHDPSPQDIDSARKAARLLKAVSVGDKQISIADESGEKNVIELPANVFKTLVRMLVEIGNGNAVAIVPVQADLTTQQAADLLNISRPYLVKLLKTEQLKYRMVGTHRKLAAKDVLNYKEQTTHMRHKKLEEMAAIDQELGLYDDFSVEAD